MHCKNIASRFRTSSKRNRFWLCCNNHMAKTSWTNLWGHYPWVNVKVCFNRKKPCRAQVSNLPNPRETDFNSVVVTTRLRPTGWTSEETIHEGMSRCVLIDKKSPCSASSNVCAYVIHPCDFVAWLLRLIVGRLTAPPLQLYEEQETVRIYHYSLFYSCTRLFINCPVKANCIKSSANASDSAYTTNVPGSFAIK
jgi:hypothetical protein